ncbi:MAG: aspartate/glutamate racemase family protein [Candidatus Eremiobacteraeota bacterium]|nr:aspartate/glutamate racemase family protein [Candidatus Eremiobacteraeota bacterium]
MLGVYDSGLGGLTVLAALRDAGIDQNVVFFADRAHVPYGDRTDHEIHAFLRANLERLVRLGVDAVIAACNTSCAVAHALGWPSVPVPVLDLIASAAASLAGTPYRRIAVVATAATARSGAYRAALRTVLPTADVAEIAAPALVPLVESGAADSEAAREEVRAVVARLPAEIDALVYGCTHFPLLDRHFAAALPPAVVRLDPARAQAAATKTLVARLGLLPEAATTTYYTNGDLAAFERAVREWTADRRGPVVRLSDDVEDAEEEQRRREGESHPRGDLSERVGA